ncbi:MAG: phospholipase D-like domain-containing protein, partial [Candidatus Latescibacterota bacterium]
MHTLIEEARKEIILVVFAIYDGKRFFEPLARKMEKQPGLKVRFCLNIPRKPTDTSLDSEVVKRFVKEFRDKHWPWETLPEVYYDPRSLSLDPTQRASLHAKCMIVDRQTALVTSANFTEAAQYRNIEAGVIVRHAPFVQRTAS